MAGMTEVHVLASDEASTTDLVRIRKLLDDAFDHEFSGEDWDHALGGWHAIMTVDRLPVSHASVVPRAIEVGAGVLNCGYVEAVATAPEEQGRGYGSRVMTAAMEMIRQEFDMGVLSTGRHQFYERLGWERWEGPAYVIQNGRRVRTADEDDGIMVLRFGSSRDASLGAAIACFSRQGDDW